MTQKIEQRLEISYLERLRLDRGLDAEVIAARADIDAITLRRLEVHGAQQPRAATVERLAFVYDVPATRLLEELREYRRRWLDAERAAA